VGGSQPIAEIDVARLDRRDDGVMFLDILARKLVVEGLIIDAQDAPPFVEQPRRTR
jgi:hypothetical protein